MQEKYPDFWNILIGTGSLGSFLAYLVIAYIAAIMSLLIESNTRDLSSSNTPVKYSYRFLFSANINRLIANLLALPLLIRLGYDWVDMKWMIGLSIFAGAIVDRAAMLLKNAGILASQKAADRIAGKLKENDPIVIDKTTP